MKPSIEHITENADYSFAVKRIIRKKRDNMNTMGVWHYHPEYEITLTIISSGQRFVGYDCEEYSAIDLTLIGENTPHCWITKEHTEQIVINFRKDFLGREFWNRPELSEIFQLLDHSKRGIIFSEKIIKKARKIINRLEKAQKFEKLMCLFSLLGLLAHDKDFRFLTSYNEMTKGNHKMSNRIGKVYNFVLNNFKNPDLSQATLASELCMTSNSLCKFIKSITRKTFYELILEARISHACRLLVNTDKYVSEICSLSGFNNVSNFNRVFKRIIKKSPLEYRKTYS